MSEYPFLADDFHIRWSTLKPECIEADIEEGLRLAEERLEAIRNLNVDEVTYENTFGALETAGEELERGWGRLTHLDAVNDNEAQRAGLNAMLPKVSSFYSSIPLDSKIWASLKAFCESDGMDGLSDIQRRLVEETCFDFVSSGADLGDDDKKRVAEISAELSKTTKKFSENVLDSTNAWELIVSDEARLAGLPKMAKEGARQDALAKGYGSEEEPKWRFSLQATSTMPVMQHADDESLRKEVWEASCTVGRGGEYDNTELVWRILELRQEKAELLGKENFCDLVLERRMAKNGRTALDFVEDLHDRIEEQFKRDTAEVIAFKAGKLNEEEKAMEPWETAYWGEKRRKEEYDFDDELLRPYFPVKSVMKGMFDICSKLFGIRIEERESVFGEDRDGAVQVWHPECTYFDIFDLESGDHFGSFYADWHPRSSKRGGAWMNSLKTGGPVAGGVREAHIGLMIGNMTKPVGDAVALLNHREVETIFHEFGHLLHHLLGDVEVKSLSGTNVPWDFVELPSQIMENYCWDRESLNMFARHFETGEVIPDELYDKMLAARNYMSATVFMRQLQLGKLDLELHLHYEKYRGRDLDVVDEEILKGYKAELATASPSFARRLSHLFSGPVAYASGYYSYKWSEVLDADAFTRFQKEGILNEATGRSFRDEILSKGNSRPVDESYRKFMGRDPELGPLLERSDLG